MRLCITLRLVSILAAPVVVNALAATRFMAKPRAN